MLITHYLNNFIVTYNNLIKIKIEDRNFFTHIKNLNEKDSFLFKTR